MEKTVDFRPFEERDIDFIFNCKNDAELNKMVVGHWKPFSYEEASMWVKNCMKRDREDLCFWAICSNDAERKIIGWVSVSNIDIINKSACFHGIVIGDKDYRDGFAWIESYLFIFKVIFEDMGLHRLYGSHISSHKQSEPIARAMGITNEGIQREAIFKNGRFYDVSIDGMLSDEYFRHKANGDYEMRSIIKRLAKLKK